VVRVFPSDTRRRLTAALAATLMGLGAVFAPLAMAEDNLEDKQKKVQKEIDSKQSDLQESSKRMAAAAAALAAARAELGQAQAKLAETRGQLTAARIRDQRMQERLDAAVAALAQARRELAIGREQVAEQRDAIGNLVAEIYESGDPRLASVATILEARDTGDITRALAATDAVVDEEQAMFDDLTAAEVLLAVQEEKVEKKKIEVEIRRQEAAEHLALMVQLEAQAEAEEAAVRDLVGARESAVRAANQAKARDQQALSALRAQEERIASELAARAAALAAQSKAGPSNGFLRYPVNGYITSPYGYRKHPIYGYWGLHNGVDFGSGCGAPLYAAADGRVMDRYYDGVYGNRLIIDHGLARGVGLATIYNHATHYVVGEGEKVKRGEVLGYMGSTGWSTGCHLHFIVMVNGKTVDPMGWF